MKRVVLAILVWGGCSLFANDYGYNDSYSSDINDDSNYEGMSGIKYKYDLSDPSDRIDYSMDLDAQMNDRLNVDPGVDMDRSMGHYGGGIQDDD